MNINNKSGKVMPSPTILMLQGKILEDLKPSQKEKLQEFKKRLNDVFDQSDNGYSLIKWLIARKYDVNAAEKMLRANLKWRDQHRIDYMMEEYVKPKILKEYYPISTYGVDREGSSIGYGVLGHFDVKGVLYSSTKNEVIRTFVHFFESCQVDMRRRSKKEGKLIETITMVLDTEDFDIKSSLWKPAFDLYIASLQTFEANYPESLKIAIVINAPKIFSVFYSLIKPFLNEETRKKVHIFGKGSSESAREFLLKYVDPDNLPANYGGNMTDADGNPRCTTKICVGGVVPISYYHTKKSSVDKVLTIVTIGLKDTFKLELNVDQPYSTINWTFQTDDHDIAFGIQYRNVSEESHFFLLPIERVNCYLVPEEGNILCKDVGTYTLIFDNSFSWIRSKKLLYNVSLQPPSTHNDIGAF